VVASHLSLVHVGDGFGVAWPISCYVTGVVLD